AGISFLRGLGAEDVVLVGHGAGGAVCIMAGVLNEAVRGVAALATDSYGTHLVHQLAPRPLLLVHGDRDHVCPPENSEMVHHEAREPKHLVRYHDAGHSLVERRDDLAALLAEWVTDCLGGGPRRALATQRAKVYPIIADGAVGPTVKELVLFQGDITTVEVDAIVCPNNDRLWAADGVAGAILRKGGDEVLREAVAQGPAPLGACVITNAGNLPCSRLLHAITFSASAPGPTTEEIILQATLACLQRAESLRLKSIAFPALGAGGAALAFESSAAVVLPAVLDHLRKH
ncbi:MAG: macro domain-containing protein, partial [Dehalococcoidia bacterium]|nr:macro domain-containing protein [Dehalococcoidia bacterium]